jgi:hypothetical protein
MPKTDEAGVAPEPKRNESDAEADSRRIQGALRAYEQALQDKDESELRRAWPHITDRKLKDIRRFFDSVGSLSVKVLVVDGPIVNGNSARVTCAESIQFTPKDSTTLRHQNQNLAFTLRKLPSADWVIEKAE